MFEVKTKDEARFWEKVQKTSGCWMWIGKNMRGGYPAIKINGKKQSAHRVSYQIHFGPIPKDRVVCHKCDNVLCVRPQHLFAGTQKDNVMDMLSKKRGGGFAGAERLSKLKVADKGHIQKLIVLLGATGAAAQLGVSRQSLNTFRKRHRLPGIYKTWKDTGRLR